MTYGGVGISLHVFLTLVLDEGQKLSLQSV
jgi:hypothetical protein